MPLENKVFVLSFIHLSGFKAKEKFKLPFIVEALSM